MSRSYILLLEQQPDAFNAYSNDEKLEANSFAISPIFGCFMIRFSDDPIGEHRLHAV
jgi:hypothetical protein